MKNSICFCSPFHRTAAESFLRAAFQGETFEIKSMTELRENGVCKLFLGFRSYRKAVFFTYDIEVVGKSPLWLMVLNWLSRKGSYIADMRGTKEKTGLNTLLFHSLPYFIIQVFSLPFETTRTRKKIRSLEKNVSNKIKSDKMITPDRMAVAYLRTDLIFGTKAGGSVGHIAGVVNGFSKRGTKVFIISTDKLELIDTLKTPINILKPGSKYNFLSGMPELHYNETFTRAAIPILKNERASLIYQRYSMNNFSGVALARKFKLPLILEYNGSEVWIARNWGRRLRFEKLATRIEMLNFHAADLITVVSQPLMDELMQRGILADKIIVNPNGVDPQRYRPDIDGTAVRNEYKISGKTVVGFIGTFGNWHGAEVLAKANVKIIKELKYSEDIHFLFIGDGVKLPETKKIVREGNIEERVTFTGLVSQERGAEYLAACDILVAPHVPNPDGSSFFGSPTKLFEYMAMGRGIVASDLDQIGEVLEHGRTAWMVKPGDAASLAEGIVRLATDVKLRGMLGKNARAEVIDKYTWDRHVEKTLARLGEVLKT
jgi:glycosyltransferase involved in cell wall biosynthesis